MQLLLFGYAINQDVRHLRAGVADLAGTQRARLLVQDAQATQVVDVVARARSAVELEALLRAGAISVGIAHPARLRARASSAATARPRSCSSTAATRSCSPAARGLAQLPVRAARRAAARARRRHVRGARLLQPGAALAGADRARA